MSNNKEQDIIASKLISIKENNNINKADKE